MLKLIDIEMIRRLNSKGWSNRRIARELKHCKKTVSSVLSGGDGSPPCYKLKNPRPKRVITPDVEAWIEQILREDAFAPRKQRHTARRIYNRLPAQFPKLSVGESTVRHLVRAIRQRLKAPETTIPLTFAPGEETQIDWWEAEVRIAGKATKLQFLLATLCHSRRAFAMAFETANQEAFCEGQMSAFEAFGGVAARNAYDNLSSAVKKILIGGEREENEFFKAFRVHHGFEARFCSPGIEGAHEKGRVERAVPAFRLQAFVPIPEFESLAALNKFLASYCAELARRPHPEVPGRTVAEVFEQEREFLRPLPKHRFRACKVVASVADGHARVQFQKCTYSLPCEYGRRRVETRAFYDRLEFYDGQKHIGTWPRCYEPGRTFYDYRHYLPLLRQKPGASLNGTPFLALPKPLLEYRDHLLQSFDRRTAARGFSRVLLQLLEHPEESLIEAVQLANSYGSLDPDAVISVLDQLSRSWARSVPHLDLSCRPELLFPVAKPELTRYDLLVEGGAA